MSTHPPPDVAELLVKIKIARRAFREQIDDLMTHIHNTGFAAAPAIGDISIDEARTIVLDALATWVTGHWETTVVATTGGDPDAAAAAMASAHVLTLPVDLRPGVGLAVALGVPVEFLVSLYQRGAQARLGPTGRYPEGAPIEAGDHGELVSAIGGDAVRQLVRIEFGTKVTHLWMPPAHAREFAAALIAKANQVEKGKM